MALKLWFGKYKGVSLEEIALGRKASGGEDEGYIYFNKLGIGDRKYFDNFQKDSEAMVRWNQIKSRLNNFRPVYFCLFCDNGANNMSVSGSGMTGYSFDTKFTCCDDEKCKHSLASRTYGNIFYPIKFDSVLKFKSSGGDRHEVKKMTKMILDLAGWDFATRLTSANASYFIDGLGENIKNSQSVSL